MTENTNHKTTRDFSWMTVAGYVLACTSFVLPVIAALLGAGNQVDIGADVSQGVASLLLVGGVAYAIVRNRNDRAKSIGLFLTGSLMCLLAFGNVLRDVEEAEATKEFFRRSMAYQQKQAETFQAFKERFERFNVSSIVTPQTMGSPSGRAEGRARLAEYRALIAERKLLLETYMRENERFVNENAPSFNKTAILEAVKASSSTQAITFYSELHRTQSALADGLTQMLDWSDANSSKFKIHSQGISFDSPVTQAQFNDLMKKVKKLDDEAQAVARGAAGVRAEAHELIEKNNAILQRLSK